ncbi:MAG TPA: hypothetical protein VJB90_01385 [Candidatus Nanoarchaeia archaeon]|nr:hypothetical protein [Candidatus Nanoarchaeia archaeon]
MTYCWTEPNGDYAERLMETFRIGNRRSSSQLERRYRHHALVTLTGLGLIELVREGYQETEYFRATAGDYIDVYFDPEAVRKEEIVGKPQAPAFQFVLVSSGALPYMDPREFPLFLGYMNSVIAGELRMPSTEYYTSWGDYGADVLSGKFRMGKK